MLLWPTSFTHIEVLPVECSIVNWGRVALLAPFYSLASLYKHAKACHRLPVGVRQILSNKKWRGWHWRKSDNSLLSNINLQITPPSPLKVATCHGALSRRILLHHVENPPQKPTDWLGGRYACGLAWLRPLSPQMNSSRSYYFALFFEVTWRLGHVIDVKHSL